MKKILKIEKTKLYLIVVICLILFVVGAASYSYFVSSLTNNSGYNLSMGKLPEIGSCIGSGADNSNLNFTVTSAVMLESAKSSEAKITATSENIVMTATPSDADSSITCKYDLTWTWNNAGGYTQSEDVSNSNKEFTYTIEKWNGSSWSAVGSESNFLTNTTTSESVLKSGLSTLGNGEEKSDTYRIVLKWYNSNIDQESQLGKTYTGTFKFGNLSNESGELVPLPILVAGPSSAPSSSKYFLNSNTVRRNQVNSVEFVDNANVPADALGFWDASAAKNGSVIAWYTDSGQTDSSGNILYNVYVGSNYGSVWANASSQYLFSYLVNASTIDADLLNTSKVSNMSYMFNQTGYNVTNFNLKLLGWDVSSVTNMNYMFVYAGYNATSFNLDLSNWNVSGVTTMSFMFCQTGFKATNFNLDLSGWDTSSVTTMSYMFQSAGNSATSWSIGDLSNWNVSSVTNMSSMFSAAGYSATSLNLDLSGWNVSSVTSMSRMFVSAGYNATNFNLDLSGWDVSSVTDMSYMFQSAGYSATNWDIGNISNWDVSSVTDMNRMFSDAGYSATSWSIGDLSGWNVSNVTNMGGMFSQAGAGATSFSLDLSNWNVSSVIDMSGMFYCAGYFATSWSITIPAKTGDIDNTTSAFYGSSTSVYAAPASGKSFTLAS